MAVGDSVRAAAGDFEAVLRAQVAEARRELAVARGARDYPGIRSLGLRLRYLLEIAEENGVQVPSDDAVAADANADERADVHEHEQAGG